MKLSKTGNAVCALTLTVLLAHIPDVALADGINSQNQMISAATVLEQMNKAEAVQSVNDFLLRSDVQKELVARGVSPEEAQARMASLSELEVKQLLMQVKEARAGGDILVAILLVVLIIYFIKRI